MKLSAMSQASHADNHDRDKLQRWWDDLRAETEAHPQVHAVFLVDDRDQHAHDAFRLVRSAYQRLSAPFHALVIFGQHGSSATARALAQGFGVPVDGMPALVLFQSHQDTTATVVHIEPPGPSGMDGELVALLDRIIEKPTLSLLEASGLNVQVTKLAEGNVEGLVEDTLGRMDGAVA